jgi:hypothetical protein
MITNIPEGEDFETTGLDYLNLAADQVFSILTDLEQAAFDEEWVELIGRSDELRDESQYVDEIRAFWQAAQRPLASALALVEQGTEFLLQAAIARVSPFLLLNGGPRDWPKQSDRRDVSFAAFRTIDAQDLVRAYNTVCEHRLEERFAQQFEQLRQRRNTVMHTVDRTLEVTPTEVLLFALEATHELSTPRSWMGTRRRYLDRSPFAAAGGADLVHTLVLREAGQLISVLTRAELRKYLGFINNQRCYVCPVCRELDEADTELSTAQLRPNTAASDTLFCFVCDQETEVERRPCIATGCRGNVIRRHPAECLTCLHKG